MQFILSPIYTPLGSEHGQGVAPIRLDTPRLARVILYLSIDSLLFNHTLEDTLNGIFTLARDFRVMTPTRGHRYTLLLLGVVGYSITFEYLKRYPIITLRATSERQQRMKSKYNINIQDILKHLKSKDTCTIAMMRQSSI